MTPLHLEGRARAFGDDINTDYIIASRRKRESLDPNVLRQYLFEEIDSAFAASVQPGDLIVAGKNFGCGSAMEVAATVVLGAGFRAVLARSFARTYYRNAVNNGLIPVVCDTRGIRDGDMLLLKSPQRHRDHREHAENLCGLCVSVVNLTTGAKIEAEPISGVVLEILETGGLAPYFRRYGNFRLP